MANIRIGKDDIEICCCGDPMYWGDSSVLLCYSCDAPEVQCCCISKNDLQNDLRYLRNRHG